MQTQIHADYLSTGANRQAAGADWNSAGLVAFGADANIALWSPSSENDKGVAGLVSGHKGAVRAVKFLTQPGADDASSLLLSGSDDKTLRLWSVNPDQQSAECLQVVENLTAPTNCIVVLRPRKASTPTLVASGAADASIHIWSLASGRLELVQSIKPAPVYIPLTLAITCLDEDEDVFVLAAAGTRNIIQVFVAESSSTSHLEFKLQATLSGHEGWIRSLDFTREKNTPGSDLLLASSSQDRYIRLWRLHQGKELPDLSTKSDPTSGTFLPGKSPSNKAHWLQAANKDCSITFEALLLGHEDWIYTARWFADPNGKIQLLSTSADNSLAMWEADPASGIWVSMVRLGEISQEKGATTATGSIGGFWTGLWAPDGKSVVCLGRTGSWRRWALDEALDQWRPAISVSGHTKAITGISWSRDGEYLMSTSSDQTSRLHGRWKRDEKQTWHEMSRPQIHGYDLNCIDTLGPSQFVSGADEKLMRVFSKPRAVARLLGRLNGSVGADDIADGPDAADMPVLGLSNKAIEATDAQSQATDATDSATILPKKTLNMDYPPLEESLSRHTLWPEVEKLYGHGYEISCLAASHDGKLIASACRASSLNHAVIRIFETEKWTEIKPPLSAHSLTATRLRFSHGDKYLLSVGRDRQWAVFERGAEDANSYTLLQANPKGHTRMILDAAWAPSTSQRVFATAGRDKRVRIWAGKTDQADVKVAFVQAAEIPCETPVTSVDFLDRPGPEGALVLAVGTEAGSISVYSLDPETLAVSSVFQAPSHFSLSKTVLQLAWRPAQAEEAGDCELAVAGEDSALRIYRFTGLVGK
ncbi:WD repeat domain-containing protein [Plectosphaerella cucumerina]|uniref:Elongator complex protein 2 n=1 Tax=Plectosphaerella cucumerina TaxID=40658 RepID=A0A8K0TKC9_9PEZI|nr:WD repeat domain-containing protein [Plectosphaerella cucumerina]